MRKRDTWLRIIVVLMAIWAVQSIFIFGENKNNTTRNPKNHSNDKSLLNSLKNASTDTEREHALDQLVRFYKKQRLDGLALSYLQKRIHLQEKSRDFAGLEASYYDMGVILEGKKDYPGALNSFFRALTYSEKIIPGRNRSGHVHLKIAGVFRVLNRNRLAEKYIRRALESAKATGNEGLNVMALNALSNLYYEKGDYSNALRLINRCIASAEKMKNRPGLMESMYRKAVILSGGGTPGIQFKVMELLRKAVDIGLKQHYYDGLLPILCEYIQRLIDRHQILEVSRYLEKIDDIYAPYYPFYFYYLYLKALFYEKQGLMKMALKAYRNTAQSLESYFSGVNDRHCHAHRRKTDEIYSSTIRFYLDLYGLTHEAENLKQALYFSEIKHSYIYDVVTLKNKSYRLLTEEKEKLELEYAKCHREYLQLQNRPEGSGGDSGKGKAGRDIKIKLGEMENRLKSLERQVRELKEFLMETPMGYNTYGYKDFDLEKLRRHLAPDQCIIKYTVLKDTIYVFRIDKHSLQYWNIERSAGEVLEKVRRLTEPLDDFTSGSVDYLRINYDMQLAHQLYGILLETPLRSWKPGNEIVIIPDKGLFKLPFEALVTGFNHGQIEPGVIFSEYTAADYVLQRYPVSYALSLFHFLHKGKDGRQVHRWESGKPLALAIFGAPVVKERAIETSIDGSRNGGRLFRPLPSAESEIRAIQSIFEKRQSTVGRRYPGKIFLKGAFNRRNFETYAPRSRVLHLATHFINNLDYPRYSALLFSPSGGSETGFYYAHEVFKLRLSAELVVLSACESSETHLEGVQGLRGMTASFRHAGVQSMLVSMWPVDEHSSKLTPLFYREYLKKSSLKGHRDVSPALRRAKLKLMAQTAVIKNGLKISYSHPFLWANYILYHFNY
jgi:CHAT domain-containing protein